MPAFNFMNQFARDIVAGNKLSTIRAPRRDGRAHCKPGDVLALYTGMRSKQCRLLLRAPCTSVQTIWLTLLKAGVFRVAVDGVVLHPTAAEALARCDGFASLEEMGRWFDSTHGLPFGGTLISWK